jgi:hypothetical protein
VSAVQARGGIATGGRWLGLLAGLTAASWLIRSAGPLAVLALAAGASMVNGCGGPLRLLAGALLLGVAAAAAGIGCSAVAGLPAPRWRAAA